MRKTFLFMDTIINKVDAKGRVSLPSDYRAIVKETSSEIVCYRSLTSPCIEGCLEDLLDKLATEIETSTDFFSQTQDDLTNLIFGDAKRFPFDSTGRIGLSESWTTCRHCRQRRICRQRAQVSNLESRELGKRRSRIRAEILKKRPVLRPVSSEENK